MKLMQLSVFLENKPGRLSAPCKILADAGVNILTLSVADTHQFGIMRLILPDWEKGKAALEAASCVVKATEVTAIEVADRPGGLENVLQSIEQAGMNVEYMYAFTARRGDKAVIVFRFEQPDAAVDLLTSKGINLIGAESLFDDCAD